MAQTESIFDLAAEASRNLEQLLEQSNLAWAPTSSTSTSTSSVSKPTTAKPTSQKKKEAGEETDLVQELGGGSTVPSRDPAVLKRLKRKERPDTAGSSWYDLPATKITPELRQDLKALSMRSYLDPKRRYKREDRARAPKYFQVGRVVESKADFYSGRIPKKERSKSFVDDILKDHGKKNYLKTKFDQIQSSKKTFNVGAKRKKSRRG